ncbi:ketosynthase chain-length factor [Streptomyces sp. NPDC050535]|uniref:ketosynthase chain-length factor n=1 Tax=Streptomyces sp. NPDC050535 TaxID=3365626 RepID=UPI0037B5DC8C
MTARSALTRDTAAGGVAETLPGAVVTGIGIAAPNGLGTDAYWAAVLRGESGIGRITRFDPSGYPVRLAGEVESYDPAEHLPGRLVPQTAHTTKLALMAMEWAVADADVDLGAMPRDRVGTVTGNSVGGLEFSQEELQKLWSLGSKHISAYISFAWFYAANTGQISIRHGLRGPGGVLTGHVGGADAVAHARRYVRDGLPLVISGAVDSAMCPLGWVTELTTRQVSTNPDPARAYLPFDTAASGYLPGEGGAIMIVEDAKAASRRGARPYGSIAGYGSTFDPPPDSGREPGLRRAIQIALRDAGLSPADIDVVFADACGVAELDRAEAAAITGVFGPHAVPVTAPKTMTGRLHSGGPALDIATALLSLRHGVIPPTINVTETVPADRLDVVLGEPREASLRTALVLARGDGLNSAVVLAGTGITVAKEEDRSSGPWSGRQA